MNGSEKVLAAIKEWLQQWRELCVARQADATGQQRELWRTKQENAEKVIRLIEEIGKEEVLTK